LQKKGLSSIGEMFFFQLWSELLNVNTLDSYQYNILNSHMSLLELLDVITGLRHNNVHISNLQDCMKESLKIIKEDDILEEHAKHIKNRLIHHLSKTIKKNENTALLRLRFQIQHALKQIEKPYLFWLLDSTKIAIKVDDNEKIHKCLQSLVSESIGIGFSSKYLYRLRDLFENNNTFEEKWDSFSKAITSGKKKFWFLFKLEITQKLGLKEIINLKDLNLDLFIGKELLLYKFNKANNLNYVIGINDYYFVCELEAYDSHSAFFEGFKKISYEINYVSFYRILEPWLSKIPKVIIIEENNHAYNYDASHLFEIHDYVDTSLKLFQVAKNVLKNKTIEPETITKLQGAFLYGNLSRTSLFQEVKFLNLWVALESFVKTGQHESIIEHLKQIIPAALCVRYYYRILRNFAEDCKRCDVQLEGLDGTVINLEESKTKVAEDLLKLLRDETKFKELEKKCEVNCLLNFRIYEIKQLIEDGPSVAKRLKEHHKKINWHLQRLYRVRNSISHSAYFSTRPLSTYIKNLSEYLSIVVTEVLHQLNKNQYSCIEEVFEALVDNHNVIVDIFETDCIYDLSLLIDGTLDVLQP